MSLPPDTGQPSGPSTTAPPRPDGQPGRNAGQHTQQQQPGAPAPLAPPALGGYRSGSSPFVLFALCLLLLGALYLGWHLGSVLFFGPGHSAPQAPGQRPSQASEQTAGPGSAGGLPLAPEQNAAIQQALNDMKGMPFEENLSPSFSDHAEQIDHAILHALQTLSLPPTAVRLQALEPRSLNRHVYTFQKMQIRTGPEPEAFIGQLRHSLATWAEKAALHRLEAAQWEITVDGVVTHELALSPAQPGTAYTPGDTPGDATGPGDPVHPRFSRDAWPSGPPVMVIVMDDMGENMTALRRLLALPFPVTLAIWPDSSHAVETARQGNAAGREIIVHQPMEPKNYPRISPGPHALFVGATAQSIQNTVSRSLERVPFAVGLNNHMGSRFTENRQALRPVLTVMAQRRRFVLDSVTSPRSLLYNEAVALGLPALKRDVFLDVRADTKSILRQLAYAEKLALLKGKAVVIGHPLPETLDALKEWSLSRNTRISLVRLQDLLARSTLPTGK